MQVRMRLLQRRIDHVSRNNWFNNVSLINHQAPQQEEETTEYMEEDESWEWSEVSLVVAAVTSVLFVFAALYLIQVHKRQWNKMQQMDEGNVIIILCVLVQLI